MKRVARFEKISYDQFIKTIDNLNSPVEKKDLYSVHKDIKMPKRATKGSAGYDFFLPYDLDLAPGQSTIIPSGIKVYIIEGWVLKIYPRSGLGFKYRLQLDNTVGIIDSDFYNNATDEGHILIKLTNDGFEGKSIHLGKNTAYAQGIFVEYGITEEDEVVSTRNGGIGSTSSV